MDVPLPDSKKRLPKEGVHLTCFPQEQKES